MAAWLRLSVGGLMPSCLIMATMLWAVKYITVDINKRWDQQQSVDDVLRFSHCGGLQLRVPLDVPKGHIAQILPHEVFRGERCNRRSVDSNVGFFPLEE